MAFISPIKVFLNSDLLIPKGGIRRSEYYELLILAAYFVAWLRSSSHAFDEIAHHTKEIFDCFLAFHRYFQVGFPVLIIFCCYL